MRTCPDCGFESDETNRTCPRCGIIFEKWEAYKKKQEKAEEDRKIAEAEARNQAEEETSERAEAGARKQGKEAFWRIFSRYKWPIFVILSLNLLLSIANFFFWEPSTRSYNMIMGLSIDSSLEELKEAANNVDGIRVNVETVESASKHIENLKELLRNYYDNLDKDDKKQKNQIIAAKQNELMIIFLNLIDKQLKLADDGAYYKSLENEQTVLWVDTFYGDEFGNTTKTPCITNLYPIKGYFSNTATKDSKLLVRFLISSSNNFAIMLFEYAGTNPVRSNSKVRYKVLIQDDDKHPIALEATMYRSDRLVFGKSDSMTLNSFLMKGGRFDFIIIEIDNPTTNYKFSIYSILYDSAYKKLEQLIQN